MSKHELIKNQGWKVIDITDKERVHAETVLRKIPDKNYHSVSEVLKELKHLLDR